MDPELLETAEGQHLYEQFLLQAAQETGAVPNLGAGDGGSATPISKPVIPKPGFCMKTKLQDGKEKVFINVCHSEEMPEARDISEEDLLKLLQQDESHGFRVPMSIGEAHAELDKSGKGCTAYDIIVNDKFFGRLDTRKVLMGFFMSIVLEGLEQKYDISLDRDFVILKNRRCVGSLQQQNIRTQSKPWIQEMESGGSTSPLISEIDDTKKKAEPPKPKAPEPPYTILQEPPIGPPEFLVAEIHLPKVKTAATLTLDIGEDRILLETRSNIYGLDIYLPCNLIQEECGAQFNRISKVLTVTMPVQP